MSQQIDDRTSAQFNTLVGIIAKLRGPNGCPWDKQQTQKSLSPYIIEEAYELVDAIESGSQTDIREELGDFLFQVVLQAQVAQDEGQFNMADVLQGLNEKLIRRHPHVFANSDTATTDVETVWKNWQKIKNAEKADKPVVLFNFPKQLPALQVAAKIGRKTQTYKFDWSTPQQVFAKVKEELGEVEEALAETASGKDPQALYNEIGDLLFSTAQLARHLGQDPEAILREGNRRFAQRFAKTVEFSGLDIDGFANLPDSGKESLWAKAKSHFKSLRKSE